MRLRRLTTHGDGRSHTHSLFLGRFEVEDLMLNQTLLFVSKTYLNE